MKTAVLLAMVALMLALVAVAQAQSSGSDQGWGPGYGPGYRMGPGMMGGQDLGMGRGYGWGHGPMSPDLWGYRYGKRMREICEKFLDETAPLRKEFVSKRFDYYEALRNSKTSSETLSRLEKEMSYINQKIWAKSPHGCWWY
jgi:hypothetical protein